jgi:hypothetical protein
MIELTEKQVEQVETQLVEKGVSLYELKESLLDHICCAIEQQLEYGKNFSDAFEEAFSAFGNNGLLRIQLETEELLNQKENPMKQTSFISGIIAGALIAIGSYFKMQHWPGANILTLLGMVTILTVFIPSLFISNYKNEFSTPGKISQLSGMISISIFIMGALFKYMHWPYATILMYAGVGGSILIYLPLLMYKNSLEKSTVARNKYVIVIFVLSIAGLTFTSLREPSKVYLEGYTSTNQNLEKMLVMLKSQEQNITSENVAYLQLKSTSDELIEQIENIKIQLIAGSQGISLTQAKTSKLSNCNDLLTGSYVFETLLEGENSKANVLLNNMKGLGLLTDKSYDDFIAENFQHKTFVVAYTNLTALQVLVKQNQLSKAI